ncbi:MAG TPA: clostripain-related cysteine peptidase, partial [Methylomirabilota bacterium]|nr:clostripain-related cysteine peptidase [Methylomirabilota bacterium]
YLTNGLVYVRVASQLGSVEELRGQILPAPTPPDDRDVFRFTIAPNTVGAAPHYVTIDYDRALGDLDLELWRLAGNTSNRAALASGQNNFISLNGQSAGTYFAVVQGRQPRTANRYDLHFSLPSTSPGTYGGTGTPAGGDWTIMVYMTASDLEAHAFTNINEMEWAAAYLPASVKFAVLWDQSAARATFGSGNGAQAPWGGTGVALIRPDTDPDTIATPFDTARFGERDTGDPATVTAFVNWAATNAPARRYALVLWDHGGGVIGGFNLDKYDFTGESVLHADELAGALAALPASIRTNLQLIAFDACLMAMTEVTYVLRDVAPIIVGSEESIATTGYDYTTAFAALASQPGEVTAEELAAGLVTAFQAQYQGHSRAFDTQSAVRSDAVSNALTTALLQFANASAGATSSDWAKIRDARSRATFFFGSPGYRDLGQFVDTLRASGVSASLSNAAQGVLAALDSAVLARASDQRNTRGLSIYFPALGPLDADYAARNGAFLVRSGWSNFLSGFFARGGGSSLAPDWAEANEVAPQAFDLRAVVGTNRFTGLNLHEPGDRDWFRFTLVSNTLAGNRVMVSAPAATLLLELHGLTNGTRVLLRAGTNSVSLAGLTAGEYLALVRGTGTGAVSNYTLTIEAPSSAAARTDWVAGNDQQDKARDLGVAYNETWFPGLTLNAGQSDWFRFATPRNQLSGGGAVLVDVIGATPLRVELYDEAGRLLPAASVATGTGTLRVDYPEGAGLAYLLRVSHPGGATAGYTIRFDPNQPPQYLIPAGSVWRYRDEGANLGTAWRAVTYTNENGWASGRARFGYGLRETTTLSPTANPASRPITTYFRHSFTLNNPAAVTNLVLRVLRDDGAVVYLNGVEIYRGNMPAGTPGYLTPAAEIAPDGSAFYSVPVTNLALLRSGLNVVAAELHQFASDSPTAGFDLELLANRAAPVYALVESGSSWKYLDDGSDQGTAWRAAAFNDSSWSSGVARLGYGGDGEKTVIRSNRTDGTRIITTWFRRAFTVENPSAISNLVVRLLCDDGGIVYLNGTEVFRRNLPAGTVSYQTLALAAVNPGADEHTFHRTNVNPALLQAGLNVLAVEVHQSSATSSDVGFDLELVVPRPNLRPYRYANWADSLVVTPAVSNYTWSGSVFYDDEELFAHWTFINESPDVEASGPFWLRLFTDDVLLHEWSYGRLDPITGRSVAWLPQGISLGRLPAGVHHIRIDPDGYRETAESDEWDNSYERLITVVSAASVPIRLSAPERVSPTTLRLRVSGPARRTFTLEATSDLGNGSWTAVGSGVFDAVGAATLTNAVSTHAQRFYRARLAP